MSIVTKLNYSFDFQEFKNVCLRFIGDNKEFFFSKHLDGVSKQLSLQHSAEPKLNKVIDGIGDTRNYKNYNIKKYNITNSYFKNTIVEKIIKDYNLYRTRLLQLDYKECYSVHKDTEKRIHIPIKTNSKSFMIFPEDNEIHYLQEGNVYLVDTTHYHTFLNGGKEARIHFVGGITKKIL